MEEDKLLERITVNPETPETILTGYDWLEPEDIHACLAYARGSAA